MTVPDIIACPDRYFRQTIYSPGPHIADYPEQAALAWILFGWCPTYVPLILMPATDPHAQTAFSCLGFPHSLDTPCRHRSAAHTDVLLGLHDEETLRKSYGIAPGGAMVCT